MRNTSLLYVVAAALAATASSAFHLPQTSMAKTSNSSAKTLSPTPSQSPWFAAAPLAIAAFVFSFAPPSMAVGGDIAKGQEIFNSANSCAGCHRGGQNFVKEKKTLQKDALEKFVGLDEEKVEAFFKGSFVHKSQFGSKLSDQDVTDVVTFVVDQAINEKW
ncbi:hypothetical protein ACHAXR_008026 [Thalassiosira sp. AJA248-18]